MAAPDTSNRRVFVRDCHRHGMARFMAFLVASQVTSKQQGLWAALRGRAPDVRALDKVPGVSHTDLYNSHRDEVDRRLEKADTDGFVTLQDLVGVKEWIADREQVEVSEPSRIETALLFVRAGGDLSTGHVATTDVLTLLDGRAPSGGGEVTVTTLRRARKAARWTS